ncbi:MAG: hypothetical protein ACFHX7_06430 [Pseudomonadota bacterium]
MFYPEAKAQWRVLLLALCLIFFTPLALSADDPGLDTDGDGLTNDVDLDDDGDGVPDTDDIAPLEAGVSTFTPTTTEDVEGARLVQTAPGSIANPSFQLGQNKGATFSFAGGGTGEYTNRSGSFPVTWSVNGNGSLAIDLLPESDDASSGFFFASQLVELGLATTESANAFVASNGDLQIEVLTVGDSETWYLLDDQDNIRVWVNGTSSASIVDDNFRQQLRGDINASPVTIEFSGERTYLDLSERALGTIDLGLGTPWGADAVLLTTSVIPAEIPGRRFNAEIVDFQANGTGTLRRTGTAVTWQFPAPDSLEISIPSTGAQVLVRQLESFTDSFGLYSVGTLGDESYADYGLGVIVTSTGAILASFTDQFLLGSFQVTDPDTRDEDGNYVLSTLFGFRLNADGTADQVNSAEPGAPLVNRWFWQEDSSTGEIVLRAHVDQSGDSWRFFSDCDPGVSPQTCVVFRERHWIPVALASDRLYVQEFELRPVDLNPGTSEQSLAIAPRAVFYERYTQDLDGDQVNDVAEVLSGADPLVAADADGDGVPDLLDAAPEDASVGAFEPILLEEVTGARVIETVVSAIADPSISLAQFKGQTYEFDEGGSGTYISGDGSIPFTWSLDERGVLQIDMNSDPADAILSFRLVSDLPSLGLATQSAADAYIQNFGNLQIGVLSRPVTEFIYSLYDDNNPFQLYRRSIIELSLQNANDREQLQGDINASPVANESGGTSYFLDLEETPVLSANTGADTPWGITNLLTHVAIDPSATQSRRFGADVIEFAAGGTGVLQASGESITWQYDASGRVIVDVPTTGSQVVLTQLNQYSDSLGIYAVGTRDGESYALYSLGVPVVPGSTDPAVVASFLDQFLVSAFSVTDPNTRDESGNIRLGTVFGYQLNTDGTARRVLSADPNQPANDLWFWEQTLAGDILLTARMDQSGQQSQAYSACDPALPTCFVFRERYWTPISFTQSRLYMSEREFLTQTYDATDPQLALSIAPRPNFYEFYTQDLDGDGLNDVRESIAQLNPLVPEADFDGDGTVDLIDDDDDNDGVNDVDDLAPFDETVGTYLTISAADVNGARIFRTAPGAVNDPTFSLGVARGETFEFYPDATGQLIGRDGSMPLTWSLNPDGSLQVDLQSESDDVVTTSTRASNLDDFGVATPEAVSSFIAANGDINVQITTEQVARRFYLLNDTDPLRFWVTLTRDITIVDDTHREQLTGDINSGAVRTYFDELAYFRDLTDLALGNMDTGAPTPWGANYMSLPVIISPDQARGLRFSSDIVQFEPNGAGTLVSTGTPIQWSFASPSTLLISVPSTGGVVTIHEVEAYPNSFAIYAQGAQGDETYADYNLGVIKKDNVPPAASFINRFLLGGFEITDPAARDTDGNFLLADMFGWRLYADGTAVQTTSVDPLQLTRWYWREDGENIVFTARIDQSLPTWGFYSSCDPLANPATCIVWRERTWVPLQFVGPRLFVLESEYQPVSLNPVSAEKRIAIAGRPFFVEVYRQDLDGDGVTDAEEALDGGDPYVALVPSDDLDLDGVINSTDAFAADATETVDSDSDGIGNNADLDDDNDGVPDVNDVYPLDPSRSQAEGPASRLKNLATRGFVGTGDNVLIGGLIITGTEPKTVVIRARGPALADAGVTGALLDPEMALFSGATVIDSNDNWETHPGVDLIPEDLKPTSYPNEAVIATTLAPGAYTAIVGGKDGTTGIGLVEIFEVTDTGVTRLQNIATRGFVDTGDGVLIGGLVISGTEPKKVVIRAKGPSLTEQGVPGALANPRIAIFSGASVIKTNDSWDSEDNLDKEKIPLDLRPTNSLEATVYMELAPGPYTAIVDGSDGGTGVGIVEVFEVLD